MEIKIKKLSPRAVIPAKAHSTDAGFDLVATTKRTDDYGCTVYGTDLAFEIPRGYVGLLFPRSSNAKKSLVLSNSVGVIDSGYRGEVTLKFRELVGTPYADDDYKVGDRVGQLIIMPYPEVNFVEVDELAVSDRGQGGYGSTGR